MERHIDCTITHLSVYDSTHPVGREVHFSFQFDICHIVMGGQRPITRDEIFAIVQARFRHRILPGSGRAMETWSR